MFRHSCTAQSQHTHPTHKIWNKGGGRAEERKFEEREKREKRKRERESEREERGEREIEQLPTQPLVHHTIKAVRLILKTAGESCWKVNCWKRLAWTKALACMHLDNSTVTFMPLLLMKHVAAWCRYNTLCAEAKNTSIYLFEMHSFQDGGKISSIVHRRCKDKVTVFLALHLSCSLKGRSAHVPMLRGARKI